MNITINATLTGQEIADYLLNEVKNNHGIVVNDGAYTIKAIVINKKDEPVEVDLSKVKFVFNRE